MDYFNGDPTLIPEELQSPPNLGDTPANHFNDSCGILHTFTLEKLQGNPNLSDTSGTIAAGEGTSDFLPANGWAMTEQDSVVHSQADLWPMASYQSVAPANSYMNQATEYTQLQWASQYWSGYQAQPQFAGPSNQGYTFSSPLANPLHGYFVNVSTAQAPTVPPAPSGIPLGYQGYNESGLSAASAFHPQNAHAVYRHSTGPTRTGSLQTGRFQPYGASCIRTTEHVNADAGPSTLIPPWQDPYVGNPTLSLSGGLSETAADAATTTIITEENSVPIPKQKKAPHDQGMPRTHRILIQALKPRLCEWAQNKAGSLFTPDFTSALKAAVEEIQRTGYIKNHKPRLKGDRLVSTTEAPNRSAQTERKRRKEQRDLFWELSRYYAVPQGENGWSRPHLLFAAMNDLGIPTEDPEHSDNSSSSLSTSTSLVFDV